jgi:hypothetical protein
MIKHKHFFSNILFVNKKINEYISEKIVMSKLINMIQQ